MKNLTTHQMLYVYAVAAGMFGAGALVKIPHLNAFLIGTSGAACSFYLALTREPGESAPSAAPPMLTQAEWERMAHSTPIQPLAIPSETEQRILDLVESANCTPEQLAEILSPFLPTQSPR